MEINLKPNQFIVEVKTAESSIELVETGRTNKEIDRESFLILAALLRIGGLNLSKETIDLISKK